MHMREPWRRHRGHMYFFFCIWDGFLTLHTVTSHSHQPDMSDKRSAVRLPAHLSSMISLKRAPCLEERVPFVPFQRTERFHAGLSCHSSSIRIGRSQVFSTWRSESETVLGFWSTQNQIHSRPHTMVGTSSKHRSAACEETVANDRQPQFTIGFLTGNQGFNRHRSL